MDFFTLLSYKILLLNVNAMSCFYSDIRKEGPRNVLQIGKQDRRKTRQQEQASLMTIPPDHYFLLGYTELPQEWQ